MNETLVLMFLLLTKHFVFDFLLQPSYMYSNKGIYGHPGGLIHAAAHGWSTWLCLTWFNPISAVWLALAETVIHYHVDWAKMNLNKKFGWRPTTHNEFWWLTGLDQYLHALTYIGIVYILTIL